MKKITLTIGFILILASLVGIFVVKNQIFLSNKNPQNIENKGNGSLYFETSKRQKLNNPFKVKLVSDSGNENINAIGIYMRFDPEKLQILEMSTTKSFCQFYPEKKFDNRGGLVSLACGAPHPGVKGKAELIEITFMPKNIGSTYLRTTSNTKILKSDGKGTNILGEPPNIEIVIANDI